MDDRLEPTTTEGPEDRNTEVLSSVGESASKLQAANPVPFDTELPLLGFRNRVAALWNRFRATRVFRPVVIGVPIFVLLGIGLAIYLPWELSKVVLPDLSELTLGEAEAELAGLDVDLQIDVNARPQRALDDFWSVTAQSPVAGTRVLPNSTVTLSGELIDVTVPALSTLSSLDEAEHLLAGIGLLGEVKYAYIDGSTIPGIEGIESLVLTTFLDGSGIHGDARSDGTIFPVEVDSSFLSSDMADVVIPSNVAGTKVTAGSTVDLVLVPPITVVPQLAGMSVADARATLTRAYLTADFGLSEDWYSVQSQDSPGGALFLIGSGRIGITADPDLAAFPALDGATWAQIIKNPDAYVGTRAVLYGEVVQFDVNTGSCAFRMQTGPAETKYSFDYDQNTYMNAGAANCALLGPIVQDDHLRMWVTVTGANTYSTSIGGTATALELDIWHFDVLPRQ